MPCILITGPVRSGKSRFAERLAREHGGPVLYVATARRDPSDAEMTARIAHHVARRPPDWDVVETAERGAPSLATVVAAAGATTLLVDSLGTWLADRMLHAYEAGGEAAALDAGVFEADATLVTEALLTSSALTIAVGDEVGWGIVPEYASGRVFRDVLGRMQQRLARRARRAYLVVAGHALDLHAGTPIEP